MKLRIFRDAATDELFPIMVNWEGYSLILRRGGTAWADSCDHWWQIPSMMARAFYYMYIKRDED